MPKVKECVAAGIAILLIIFDDTASADHINIAPSIANSVGIVITKDKGGILYAVDNANLKTGMTITVIGEQKDNYTHRQWIKPMTVKDRIEDKEDKYADFTFQGIRLSLYELSSADGIGVPQGLGITGTIKTRVESDTLVTFDLEKDGRPEYLYSCTGNEGVNLYLRSGDKVEYVNRAHFYYYIFGVLGYEIEATCKRES